MSDNVQNMESSGEKKSGLGFIAKVGGVYAAITSFVSDILNPIFEFTLLFLIISAVFVAAALVLRFLSHLWKPASELNAKLARDTHNLWFGYYFGAGVLSLSIFTGMYILNNDDQDGFLAEHVEFFKALQDDLGIAKAHLVNIDEEMKKMSQDMEKGAKHAQDLAEEQKKSVALLKEIANPEDARKALVSYGFRVNADDYAMKLNEGDTEMVSLFYKAGLKPAVLNRNGHSPLFDAIMLHTPNIYPIMDSALDAGYLEATQKILPEMGNLEKRKYFDSFNEWLGGQKSGLFRAMETAKIADLKNIDLGGSLVLAEFSPSSATIDFIARHKLDMSQGIKIREAIAESYAKYINDQQKWAEELQRLDSNLSSSLAAMRDRKSLPNKAKQAEMLNDDANRRLHFVDHLHPGFEKFATTPFEYVDGAISQCIDRRSTRCNELIDRMLASYKDVKPEIEKEINSLNIERAKSRLALYQKATRQFAEAQRGANIAGKLPESPGIAPTGQFKAGISHEALVRAISSRDAESCAQLFRNGLDPNDSANAWLLFKAFIEENPASMRILEAAIENGFDVNRETVIARGDALAFMTDQREKLEKWFSADGLIEGQKLITGTDAGINENAFNLASILALISIEPDARLEEIAARHELDATRGAELRNTLHAAFKNGFSALIDNLNAFINKENDIYNKMLTLKNCKNLDKYTTSDFINDVRTPFTSTMFDRDGNIYDILQSTCAYTKNSQEANEYIERIVALFPEKTREFKERLEQVKIPEVSARLNEYKKSTAAIGRLGK